MSQLRGDAEGPIGANTVVRIQGRPVAAAVPTDGQSLVFRSAAGEWRPESISPGPAGPLPGTTLPKDLGFDSHSEPGNSSGYARADHSHGLAALAGDVSGAIGNVKIDRLQGVPVQAGQPAKGDVLTFDGQRWVPGRSAGGGGLIEVMTAGVVEIDVGKATAVALNASHRWTTTIGAQVPGRQMAINIVVSGISDANGPRKGFVGKLTPVLNPRAPALTYLREIKALSATQVRFIIVLFAQDLGKDLFQVHCELSRFVPVSQE